MSDAQVDARKTVALVQTQAENAGAQEVARQLAAGFEKRGWRTRQLFFYRRTDAFDTDPTVFYCTHERPGSPLAVVKMLDTLYREFRRDRPDVVITLQHYGNLIAAPLARLARTPVIIANQLTGTELVPQKVRFADKALGVLGFYDHIVVNSGDIEAAYSNYPDAYVRRIKRIDHGFRDKSSTLSKEEARNRLGLPQGIELLGCAARLHPQKRLDLAIRLLVESPGQHLALAGQGEDFGRLQQAAAELGVSARVHFLGELGAETMGAFLAAIDCFVFPSEVESFGLAPAEAAQAGVPVVASDLPVLREVLAYEDEPCALFVDATNTKEFSTAVRKVFDDKEFARRLTDSGRRLVERFPLDNMVDGFLQLMNTAPGRQ